MTHAFSGISKTLWAFITLLIIIAGLVGYVLGERGGPDNTAAPNPSPTEAKTVAELAALATPGANGTAGNGPQPQEDGTFDAMVFGPGGPLEKQEDIYNVHRRSSTDPFAIGALDAPVVISEFSDFECPFCSRFANQTEPTILADYVDKGLVRLEWNDFAINGPNAEAAARAGRAAAAQGKFIEFKHALYAASKNVSGHPNFTLEDFVRFAEEAGVADIEKFREDAAGDKYTEVVEQARSYASSIGMSGTPGFIIGGQFVSGAQPTEVFVETINAELAKVTSGEVTVPKGA